MANIEIDGKQFDVENGKTIIEVADENGIPIPRFCYHKKLAVAANCRMCLVEVEKSRKPLPACATTITDGMKIFTKSTLAEEAQKAVMEFLLINHPLDCPICDQGGECELQDVSLGFGQDFSDYDEKKRAVVNDDLGTLVATEMTRCIHCTRCVRFGQDVAGIRELGGTGRGEHMQIGTYVQHSLQSEISANIIDLCPVGALTSKPFQFRARAWELQQHPTIAPHDALGSNLELHVRRDEVMRVVPKENEQLNETWISDRDRFSYLSINNSHRLLTPMIKEKGAWRKTDWATALSVVVAKISTIISEHGFEQVAAFASPSSTLEELYLFQKLMRSQGINNLDHRLHQTDFSDQAAAPLAPITSMPYENIEKQTAILLVGTHLNHELPLANVRVRKAFLNGAKIMVINPIDYELNYPIAEKIIDASQHLIKHFAGIVKIFASLSGKKLPKKINAFLDELFDSTEFEEEVSNMATYLHNHTPATIILGVLAQNHPQAGILRTLVNLMESMGVNVVRITEGSNTAGAWLAGMIPHRAATGHTLTESFNSPEMTGQKRLGLDIQAALKAHLKAYIGLNIDPQFDIANPHLVHKAFEQAECIVMITSFVSDTLLKTADVLLPSAIFAETSGTYVNLEGIWQTFKGAVSPKGEARPAWKIFRVLGNLFGAEGFEYHSSEDVLNEIKDREMLAPEVKPYNPKVSRHADSLTRIGEWPIYRCDDLCRYADELQHSAPGEDSILVKIHPETAKEYKIKGDQIRIDQEGTHVILPYILDERIAKDTVYIPCAIVETKMLGEPFGELSISAV
jgi:NADH-quinone oxidoreductase subunit G